MGRMNYVRVYSGTLAAGGRRNASHRQVEERVARVLQLYANKREDVGTCTAGDIVSIIGFKQSFTGDTLCAADAPICWKRSSSQTRHPRGGHAGDDA